MIENSIEKEKPYRLKSIKELLLDDKALDTKKEGLTLEPNFLNQECSIEFNVERELETNAVQLTELVVRDYLDNNIKVNLLLERVELLKLKELIDDIKEVKQREILNQEIQKEIIPHIVYSNEVKPKPILTEQQRDNAILFSDLNIRHYNLALRSAYV